MHQPLGNMVGNALEVKEAIETLDGRGPEDLMELSYVLGAYMLIAAGKADSLEEGMTKLRETIENKSALNKFREFIEAQGGDGTVVENTELLPKASIVMDIISEEAGFIKHIDTSEIGMVSLILGGGRETKDSEIDLSVGIELKKKIGDRIEKEEVIATIYANDLERLKAARERLDMAYEISVTPVNKQQLVKWVISKNGAKKY